MPSPLRITPTNQQKNPSKSLNSPLAKELPRLPQQQKKKKLTEIKGREQQQTTTITTTLSGSDLFIEPIDISKLRLSNDTECNSEELRTIVLEVNK